MILAFQNYLSLTFLVPTDRLCVCYFDKFNFDPKLFLFCEGNSGVYKDLFHFQKELIINIFIGKFTFWKTENINTK